ncbi:MAG: hypothetical protein OXC66_08965 [Roseovarius sp.]|nr:hypothetical protein [Roseovarius sp.]
MGKRLTAAELPTIGFGLRDMDIFLPEFLAQLTRQRRTGQILPIQSQYRRCRDRGLPAACLRSSRG